LAGDDNTAVVFDQFTSGFSAIFQADGVDSEVDNIALVNSFAIDFVSDFEDWHRELH
jgi:hypothetical protein